MSLPVDGERQPTNRAASMEARTGDEQAVPGAHRQPVGQVGVQRDHQLIVVRSGGRHR
jgi:hypothetical protein